MTREADGSRASADLNRHKANDGGQNDEHEFSGLNSGVVTLLLQPKLNTTLVSWLALVDFLHMPTAVQMVPTIAVRHFIPPIRGKKEFVAFGQENMTDSISFPRATIFQKRDDWHKTSPLMPAT